VLDNPEVTYLTLYTQAQPKQLYLRMIGQPEAVNSIECRLVVLAWESGNARCCGTMFEEIVKLFVVRGRLTESVVLGTRHVPGVAEPMWGGGPSRFGS
jgi:hypothetical protein